MFALLKSPLFLKGAAIVAILLLLVGWWTYHNHKIRMEERAKWVVQVQQCKDQVEVAAAANRSMLVQFEKLRGEIEAQNKVIQTLKQQEAKALAEKNEKLAVLVRKEMKLRDEILRLKAIASGPPAPTFEGGCREAYVLLRDYVVNRVLDTTQVSH